jgi:D-alanine-D-alanine ligase
MTLVVLGGGESTEREVSLRSAAAVANALNDAGYEPLQLDPKDGFEILDSLPKDPIVLPILHGQNGEDGVIQYELERRNIPFLGSTSQVSRICFDKWLTREMLEQAGLPIAGGEKVTKDSYPQSVYAAKPHVLKVTQGGSSIGTYIVRDPMQIDPQKVADVFAVGDVAVVEELIEGVEITVPVLGDQALPVIEIKPPADKDFDYENKYNGATQELCPPASLDESQQQTAQVLALQAHQVLGCRHLSRTDIIVRPDNTMVILELNTMPGMTEQSLFPLAARVAGMSTAQLMQQFVKLIKTDYKLED